MTAKPNAPEALPLEPDTAAGPPGRVIKHSLSIAGHRTSISLEAAFWRALRQIAAARDISIAMLAAEIDTERGEANLSSAIRVYVLAATQHGAMINSAAPPPDR